MSKKHRCSSCGYVGEPIDADAPVPEAAPAYVAPQVIEAAVVQQSCCPMCRMLFDAPADYDAHRARNCAPAPEVEPAIPTDPDEPEARPEMMAAAAEVVTRVSPGRSARRKARTNRRRK